MQTLDYIEFYDFGDFRLDVRNRLLRRGERQINLALKEFEVLFFLIENAGRVVEKTELHEAVWKNTFIEEGTLTQNISRLRKKLEAAGESQKIIETLPKRGYRFLPDVTPRRAAPPAPLVIAEERTVQRIDVEQTISLPENFRAAAAVPGLTVAPEKTETRNPKLKWLWAGMILTMTVAAAALYFLKTATSPKSLVAASVKPFSGAPGREDSPAFSPDGKQIVYAWDGDESATTDIYLRLTTGGESVRLTETAAKEHYPVFSPDGSQIAFVRDLKTHGEVFLIPALGGTERRVGRLFSGNYSISFAPDGNSIAVIDTVDSTDKKQYAVYLVDLQTGARRRLTAPAEFRGETTPRFSPDGKELAFVRVFDDQRQDLFVVSAENQEPTEPRQITFDQKTIHSLAWSADGTGIFFVSFRGTNRAGLWRVPASGEGQPETVLTGGREITNLAISPDGKTIAFIENAPGNSDIWQVSSDRQKPQKFLASTFNDFYPTFAPDGSRVVFTSNRSGKNELWTADPTGKNPQQLTKTEFNVGRAVISPDGKRAAFETSGNLAAGIYTVEIETGMTRELVASNGSFDALPAWSGDGRFVYFTSNRTGKDQIWKIAADGGGEPVQITTGGGQRAYPAPDGRLFISKSKDRVDFWQIPAEGGSSSMDERPIPEIAAGAGGAMTWTANRDGIYFFVKESEDFYAVKFYDFAARQIKSASGKITLPEQMSNLPIVSSDGKRFLFATDTANAGSIMLAAMEK